MKEFGPVKSVKSCAGDAIVLQLSITFNESRSCVMLRHFPSIEGFPLSDLLHEL